MDEKVRVGRRDFLKGLGAGTGAAAAAVGSLTSQACADSESSDERRKSRYKETDHVKAYYRVNKYPG